MTADLTTPQRRELKLMACNPQNTYGAPRTRVQNKLVELGLARYVRDGDLCEITDEGREALGDLTKHCSKCHERKDMEDFYRSSTSSDGRQSRCKKCERTRSRGRSHDRTGTGHPRKFGRFCSTCCGMPHRVKGDKCAECGTPAPER
jgi:hypothetical protein